jgi:hypothetical protein
MNPNDSDPSAPVMPTPPSAQPDAEAPRNDAPAAASQSAEAVAANSGETAGAPTGGDEQQRRRNRNRRRGRRNRGERAATGEVVGPTEGEAVFEDDDDDDDEAAVGEEAAAERTPVDVGERFADAVSGLRQRACALSPMQSANEIGCEPNAPKLYSVMQRAPLRRDMEQPIADARSR